MLLFTLSAACHRLAEEMIKLADSDGDGEVNYQGKSKQALTEQLYTGLTQHKYKNALSFSKCFNKWTRANSSTLPGGIKYHNSLAMGEMKLDLFS